MNKHGIALPSLSNLGFSWAVRVTGSRELVVISGIAPMVAGDKIAAGDAAGQFRREMDYIRERLAGWPVTRKEVLTARGEAMEFVSFEDETAIYETVLFPEEYRSFSRVLDDVRPYIIEGTVESDQGAVSLTAKAIRPLPGPRVPGPARREPGPLDTARYHSPFGRG